MAVRLAVRVLLVAAGAAWGTAAAAQEPSRCASCHEKEHRAELGAVHASGAASCVDCHGGEPKAAEKEKAHSGSYTGKLDRRKIAPLCARCHSDARRMNPFGLPIDQHAQYLTSKHGEALAGGKLDAATCTDCHGGHGIRRARDPASAVHPARIAATCGRCHSDPNLMARHDLSADAEAGYRDSVHARVLAAGDLSAPGCATCHGNHGATPPGFSDVGKVCGKCHVPQKQFFEASPHAFYAKDGSFKECVVCHANHRIVQKPREILGRCAPCHEPGDAELKKSEAFVALLEDVRGDFDRTKDLVAEATREGFHTDEEEGLLEEARTVTLRLPPLQHALDRVKVDAVAGEARARLREIRGQIESKRDGRRMRKLALIPIWMFLLSLAWLFTAKRRQLAPTGTASEKEGR